jgi:hypothetical protein
LADLFNASGWQATTPAPTAEEECLSQPGKSTADGQHWVYRFDGHRKCWFQAAEGSATVKKPHRRTMKHRVLAAEKNETALRQRKAIADAHAELLRSAPVETPQPTPPTPEFKVADADRVPATGGSALAPPVPVVPMSATDQLTPDHSNPRQINVEKLLAAAPAATDAVAASVRPATPGAFLIADADEGWGWTWFGVLLMSLGLVSVLSSSRTLRWLVLWRDLPDGVGHRG